MTDAIAVARAAADAMVDWVSRDAISEPLLSLNAPEETSFSGPAGPWFGGTYASQRHPVLTIEARVGIRTVRWVNAPGRSAESALTSQRLLNRVTSMPEYVQETLTPGSLGRLMVQTIGLDTGLALGDLLFVTAPRPQLLSHTAAWYRDLLERRDTSITGSPRHRGGAPLAGYRVESEPEVQRLLSQVPEVAAVLAALREEARRYFGDDASLRIRVAHDPSGGRDELAVDISSSLSVDEAISALERFDSEWWLDASESVHGFLTVTLR